MLVLVVFSPLSLIFICKNCHSLPSYSSDSRTLPETRLLATLILSHPGIRDNIRIIKVIMRATSQNDNLNKGFNSSSAFLSGSNRFVCNLRVLWKKSQYDQKEKQWKNEITESERCRWREMILNAHKLVGE